MSEELYGNGQGEYMNGNGQPTNDNAMGSAENSKAPEFVQQEGSLNNVQQEVLINNLQQNVPLDNMQQEVLMNKLQQNDPLNNQQQNVPLNNMQQEVLMNKLQQNDPLNNQQQNVPLNNMQQEVSLNNLQQNIPMNNIQQEVPANNLQQEVMNNYGLHQNNGQNYYYNGYQNQTNGQQYNNNPYQSVPTPPPAPVKMQKKKRRIPGIFKLTAAALAFGIIAGVAFQGFYYVMDVTGHTVDKNDSNRVEVSQVTQNTDNGDTIVPAKKTSGNSVVTDVSDIVEKAMPSIVAINSNIATTSSDFFGRAFTQEAQASGSGIIIAQNDSKLLIVTNNHVIDGATSVEIVFADNSKATAEIKGADASADLAVLSVDMKSLTDKTIKAIKVATLGNSDAVQAGDMAIAIGNALGYGQSVTVGYISAVNRTVDMENDTMTLLQTDAAINPGNSGGALLNTQGEVIGINSVKYASTEVEGMGYAIPISSAIPMINELMNRQAVSANEQGYLGIKASTAENVTSDYAERFNMPVGIYVNDILKNSPAERAGLKRGNIIVGVDDIKVETIDDLVNVLSYKKAGDQISLKIEVKESGAYAEKTLDITLGHK